MTDQNQKKRTGMASLAAAGEGEGFSVIDAIGGPRGVIESMLPGVLFVVLFVVTSNLNLTIGVSAALAVLLAAAIAVPLVTDRSFAPLAAAAGYGLAVWYGFRQLDGMNGDISGFALTLGELAGAAVWTLVR